MMVGRVAGADQQSRVGCDDEGRAEAAGRGGPPVRPSNTPPSAPAPLCSLLFKSQTAEASWVVCRPAGKGKPAARPKGATIPGMSQVRPNQQVPPTAATPAKRLPTPTACSKTPHPPALSLGNIVRADWCRPSFCPAHRRRWRSSARARVSRRRPRQGPAGRARSTLRRRPRIGRHRKSQVWSETPIRDTSCYCHTLTGVPCLRPGPRTAKPPAKKP